jgi:hypothetical protein
MTIALPRFQQLIALVDANGYPTPAFHIWWDKFAKTLEDALNDQASQLAAIETLQTEMSDRIAEITQLQNDMLDRITEIEAAQAAADAAQASANTVHTTDKISVSATVPSTILNAFDAGTDATITVAAHTRIYGDGTTVTVGSPVNITGLAYSTTYAVYYDDPTTSTTSPSYVATNILSHAQANYASGRHFVGQVSTPASGGGSTSGGNSPPSGGGPYP